MSKIVKINKVSPEKKVIEHAAEVLQKDGLVVYPTDTCYGIGANAYSTKAIEKVYKVMDRPLSQPTHVVVKNWQMIKRFTVVNEKAKKLHDQFLPGTLTLVLRKKGNSNLADNLTGNLNTLGVRIPDNPITQAISSLTSNPYTTPSANRSGEPSPYTIPEVSIVLDLRKIDLVLDAGELSRNKPSTLVDLLDGNIKIIREGNIKRQEIIRSL